MTFEPGLRRFVLVPLAANIILFSLMGWLLFEFITDFYDAAMLTIPEWLQFLSWIITPLLWLIGGLMTGYLSTFVVLMLTSPFHALLAEKVEEGITGEPVPALDGIAAPLIEVPRALFREIRKVQQQTKCTNTTCLDFISLFNKYVHTLTQTLTHAHKHKHTQFKCTCV